EVAGPVGIAGFTGKVVNFARANEKNLYTALVVLLAGVLVFTGVRFYLQRRADSAAAAYDSAKQKFVAAINTKSQEDFAAARDGFAQVVENYRRTQGGRLAQAMLGNTALQAGNFDEALAEYEKALPLFKKEPLVLNMIISGMAYAAEGKKDWESAARHFGEIADDPASLNREDALLGQARALKALGENARAKQVYQTFINEFPDSFRAQ
ncbi:MAG: tetratricopeptide repeat protein, partial [Desulfatibacillaceae bacterium]|nr:tetratricopeptide repeat protein [Desulfatibacillaceae bacterium]